MVEDGEPGRVLSDERSYVVAGYVDKFFVFSRPPSAAQRGRDAIAKRLSGMGFAVHVLTSAPQEAEFQVRPQVIDPTSLDLAPSARS